MNLLERCDTSRNLPVLALTRHHRNLREFKFDIFIQRDQAHHSAFLELFRRCAPQLRSCDLRTEEDALLNLLDPIKLESLTVRYCKRQMAYQFPQTQWKALKSIRIHCVSPILATWMQEIFSLETSSLQYISFAASEMSPPKMCPAHLLSELGKLCLKNSPTLNRVKFVTTYDYGVIRQMLGLTTSRKAAGNHFWDETNALCLSRYGLGLSQIRSSRHSSLWTEEAYFRCTETGGTEVVRDLDHLFDLCYPPGVAAATAIEEIGSSQLSRSQRPGIDLGALVLEYLAEKCVGRLESATRQDDLLLLDKACSSLLRQDKLNNVLRQKLQEAQVLRKSQEPCAKMY